MWTTHRKEIYNRIGKTLQFTFDIRFLLLDVQKIELLYMRYYSKPSLIRNMELIFLFLTKKLKC